MKKMIRFTFLLLMFLVFTDVLRAQGVEQILFSQKNIDFGEVKEHIVVEKTFELTNNSASPLLILDILTTCGCTATEWKKEPILPNEKTNVKVRFDTKGKVGRQHKSITLITNTQPERWVLTLSGIVLPEK